MARVAMIVWNDFRHDARVLKQAETLQAAGHSVIVHALHTPSVTRAREVLASGVAVDRVTRIPFWGLFQPQSGKLRNGSPSTVQSTPANLGLMRQLLRVLARSITHIRLCWRLLRARADVIHAHDVNTLPTAYLAARLCGAKLVFDAHEISTDREGYRSLRKFIGWVEKHLMPRAAATITTTDARAKFFARAYHIDRPLVLQNRPRMHLPEPTDLLRRELGLTDDRPIIVYQGGLQAGRGLARIVEAAAHIDKAHFVFIGGGRLQHELQAQVTATGIGERVHFIPTVPLENLPDYTASADIGVQAIENTCLNHFTTDSNKLFEYMMAGLPIVVSNLPEIRKVMNRAQFGRLVPPGDTEALTAALIELVSDKDLRQKLSVRARAAATQFNWEAQEPALLEMYQRVLAR